MVLKPCATFVDVGRQLHVGFTFLMVRMTEVLAPDILEFTSVYTYNTFSTTSFAGVLVANRHNSSN
jgi:hypothetical protein